MADDPAYLRVDAVARRLGVAHATVRKWADDGKLPCWKTPAGQRRFRPEDVEAFITQGSAA